MLYCDVEFSLFQLQGQECAWVHKSIKQSYVSKYCFKKAAFLLVPDDISEEAKLFETMNMFANFCYDKDIMGKEKCEIRDDNKDCVAINMVKHVKNKRRIVILLTVKIMTKKLLNDEE